MKWSNTFIPTIKEDPQEAESISHKLMLRSGLIRQVMAGVYSYLPLGLKVLNNVTSIIREEMNASGASELLLPALQPRELWVKSGRDSIMGEVMIRFVDRRGRNVCLGPTHEEIITDLVKDHVSSYRDLPLLLYQIQTKFRDEIRPRFGLVRSCEFIMKDAYSFDKDQQGLDKNYATMHQAYKTIFNRCGLSIVSVEADSGIMGGNVSHEFMVPAAFGEDIIMMCPSCKAAKPFKEGKKEKCSHCQKDMEKTNTLEVGHIFQLGTKYSSSLEANFADAEGQLCPIIMGCYGIGVSRLIPAIIEQNHDENGITWPLEISPYKVIILALDPENQDIMSKAASLYNSLKEERIDVLLDDRDVRAGIKFKDADLLGISLGVIVGKDSLKNNTIELKIRKNQEKIVDKEQIILDRIRKIVHG